MDTFFALQTAVAGRYSLVREIGRGGMGIVFLARDVALDRPVAIKLLPPMLAGQPQLRERFLREARTVAQLAHPNIVPIHAVEEHHELVFFVMAYVDGETLGARVRRSGPIAPIEATRVMQEVAWALSHAHARGIVHRDVKPDNVMLEAESGRAIVTDFGIAAAGGAATPSGGVAIARGLSRSFRAATPGVQGRVMRLVERWMFRTFGVKNAPRAITDGEATVVALGGAIHDAWRALPDDARAQLAEVPAVAAKLEDDAVQLRDRIDDPRAAERLRTVVVAMEALRLDLLRVKEGSAEPSSITQQLDAAREVGAQVDAMLHARGEVSALLRPDSTPA